MEKTNEQLFNEVSEAFRNLIWDLIEATKIKEVMLWLIKRIS